MQKYSFDWLRHFPTVSRWLRQVLALSGLLVVAVALSACDVGVSPRGELAQDQQIVASCDPAAPLASDVQLDESGSSDSDVIREGRMAAVESIVRTTAICSGRLRVLVFSATSAGTVTLFDGPLDLHGATDNARLKRVPQLVEDVMAQIRERYQPAVKKLPQGGTDVTAQYRLASEWFSQLGGNYRLSLTIFTDGLQTEGINLYRRALTKREAAELANRTPMPKLPGASVTVAGLGRVAGSPPSSRVVEGLISYYDALCKKAGAANCVSVTDYVAEGR